MTGSLKSMDREEEQEEKSQSSIQNKIHVKAISNDAYTTHTHTPRYDGTSITNVHNECPIIDDQKKKKSDDDGVW